MLPRVRPMKHVNECRSWDSRIFTPLDAEFWVFLSRRRQRLRHCLCSFALQQTLHTDLVRRFPQRGDAVEHQQKWDTKFRISGRKVSLKIAIGKCMSKDDGRTKSKSKSNRGICMMLAGILLYIGFCEGILLGPELTLKI